MNTHAIALIIGKLVLGSTMALGLALTPHAMAHTQDTVLLSTLPSIDTMPICTMEDGSDIPSAALPCIWTNQGAAWLTYADHSVLIIDDTVR